MPIHTGWVIVNGSFLLIISQLEQPHSMYLTEDLNEGDEKCGKF